MIRWSRNYSILMWRLHQHYDNKEVDMHTWFILFNVLREPLKAFTIPHLADNTAHENLQRAKIGVSQINLALACGEVSEAHVKTKLILWGSIRYVNLVSQDKERHICKWLVRKKSIQLLLWFWKSFSVICINQVYNRIHLHHHTIMPITIPNITTLRSSFIYHRCMIFP